MFNWSYPKLIAHRGAGRQAPENTLSAIRLGAQHGYRMMEFDVKLTRDGIAVLLHDDTIDRTSGATGCAGTMTYAELAEFDFGSWHSARYAGEPIATLRSVAAFTLSQGICSNIEIKPHTGTDFETGHHIARMAQRYWQGADQPPLLSSFSETALQAARKAAPELPRALLLERELPENWRTRLQGLDCVGVNMDERYITHDIVQRINDAGFAVTAWTVNLPARAQQLLDWGCRSIITDEILLISPVDA